VPWTAAGTSLPLSDAVTRRNRHNHGVNYLAHLHLAGDDTGLLVGALLGDFMRGVDHEQLSPELRDGVQLHRSVDRFTDGHDAFRHSRRLLFDDVGHWAGVVVDVVYDHVLARDWGRWHHEPLPDFSARVFGAFATHDDDLPDALRQAWRRMQEIDLFDSYRRLDGALAALRRSAGRSRHAAQLVRLEPAVASRIEDLATDFEAFYPDLVAHVAAPTRSERAG